jgi:hypothetical protein
MHRSVHTFAGKRSTRIGIAIFIAILLLGLLTLPLALAGGETADPPPAPTTSSNAQSAPSPARPSLARAEGWLAGVWARLRGEDDAEALLRRALEQARDAGGYVIDMDLAQAITPEDPFGLHPKEEWAQFELRGEIAGPTQARFRLSPQRASFAMEEAAKEILVLDGAVYEAEGDRWQRTQDAPATLGLDSTGLTLLDAASDLQKMEPVEGLPLLGGAAKRSYQRVGFKLQAEDILRLTLAQQGALSPENLARARVGSPKIVGEGELWIDASGYPARLLLDMNWRQIEDAAYRVRVHTETNYSHFGERFPPGRFDPAALPGSGLPGPTAGLLRGLGIGLWVGGALALLGLLWLLARSFRGSRRAFKAVSALMVAILVAPMFAQVVEAGRGVERWGRSEAETQQESESGQAVAMMADLRQMRERMAADDPNPAQALVHDEDEDGDGLPNGYEVRYGTSPFSVDTDFDGINDYDEINGVVCQGQNQSLTIKTNPMMPDSNQDGLADGEERHRGKCGDSYLFGWAWDDDNDNDNVPDSLDLSPFSASRLKTGYMGNYWPTPNFTFDTLDQNPDDERTTPYPFYVELQIRPYKPDSLRWAYKTLFWPEDDEASIRVDDPTVALLKEIIYNNNTGTTGQVRLIPMMQATLRERDLPTASAMQAYGVSASRHKDADGNPASENGEPLWDMLIPLMTVERGGQVFAFQAKMLHDRRASNNSLTRHWRDVRLKWAVVADVALLDENGIPKASPNEGYGLWVYDEAFELTGMQVSRQGGASMLLATALPSNQPYDDGPIALLRGGLEVQYLGGAIDLTGIKARFDTPNNASDEERWGIPQSQEYRVVYGPTMNYKHMDEAIATTTMTTTVQTLEGEFGMSSNLKPTVLFASEQRTSTVNLDDDPPQDYLDISLNTCLKPLYTTRSLKLQTYQNVVSGDDLFGHWEPMSLDQVLAKVEGDYASVTDPEWPYYEEELLILKMATTAWQVGVTSVYKIGQLTFVNIYDTLTNPEMVLAFLDADGLLPTGFKQVMEQLLKIWVAGGPTAWLQQQWTTVVEYWDKADHFFRGSYLDMANKTPDSYIKVIPQGQDPGGGQPAPPGEPIDLTLLGYTQTAITVLGLIAMWYEWQNGPSDTPGVKEFGQVLEILTKIIQIYQKFRQLVDTIKTIINVAEKAKDFANAAVGLTKELSSMVKPLAVVGLLFTVAIIWIAVLVQFGDLGPNVALAVVARAIVETVLAVVLFVIALIYPVGTIVAIAIGLIKLIESLIGFQFDPISLLLSWLFDVKAVQRTDLAGDPQFGQMTMEPKSPGAGVVSGASFRLNLPVQATMTTVNDGTGNDLSQSHTEIHVGRFADWLQGDPNISTPSKDLFNKYKEAVGGYYTDEFHAAAAHIIYFSLYNTFGFNAGHKESKGSVVSSGNQKKRTDSLLGYADVYPATGINQKMVLDISMDIQIRYDQCSNAGGCDAYISKSTSPPAFSEFWFDILPIDLDNMWEWEDLVNYDPDGDGLSGYKIGNGVYGLDANLCPNLPGVKTWEEWDSDNDGLSDLFEKQNKGFNPCDNDSDNDGLDDEWELVIGTFPDDADTDNDGLKDKEEVPYDNGFNLVVPWLVNMEGIYPGLPNPPAYPNPRQANFDADHRNDKQEKTKLSSPTSFDAVPVGEPLPINLGQGYEAPKGQFFNVTSATWENDEAVALNATLTLTLPVTSLANTAQQARLQPPVFVPQLNNGTPLITNTPNVFRWALPPLSKGRFLQVSLTGTPQNPTQPQTVSVALEYDEGGVHQVSLAEAPLLVNAGGPVVTFTNVQGAVVLQGLNAAAQGGEPGEAQAVVTHAPFFAQSGGLVTFYVLAEDPERVKYVLVCVKTSDSCASGDWEFAGSAPGLAGSVWSYSFDPPADGVYFARAYGIDTWDRAGQTSDLLKIGVDQSAPVQVSFDLGPTAYLATSSLPGEQPSILLSGQVQDAVTLAQAAQADYVSGVGAVSVLMDQDAQTVDAAQPGQPASPFSLRWTPPPGDSVRTPSGAYDLVVGATDVAGNPSAMSDTLKIVIDNLAPMVYSTPPQVVGSTVINLSGLADDTALVGDRQPANPFASAQTSAQAETQFTVPGIGKAVVVGDVSGDAIDDVVVLFPATGGLIPIAFRAGLYFGRPGGLPANLTIANADVVFNGETPFTPNATVGPSAAGLSDVNGDGVGDLALGDPAADSGKGRVYVIFGRRSGWTTPVSLANAAWKLSIANTSALGGSVASAGDVNGDGLSDLLAGAASILVAGAPLGGPAWLYLGREQNAPAGFKTQFTPPGAAAASPPNLAGLGDTNGDGLSDFLVAARNTPAALVLGRTSDAWPATMPLSSQAAAHLSGGGHQTVAHVGDVNADGLNDLLLGSPDIETPSVFVVYGRRAETPWPVPPAAFNLAAQADASFVGARGSRLGLGLTGLGDADGDGRADFAFGQPGSGSGPNRTALALTSFTGLTRNLPVDAATRFINGTANSQRLGEYLSSGDVSGDHVPDLLAGAPGENKAYLFLGDFDPGGVAGIASVEIGLFGPVVDPSAPYWQPATLASPNARITGWTGALTAAAVGDYRLYARASDRAGNRLSNEHWYLGNVWVTGRLAPMTAATVVLNPPSLANQTDLTLNGSLTVTPLAQHFRVYDGYAWRRLPPANGAWSQMSVIPRSDLRSLKMLAVARDAFGTTTQVARTLAVDTVVAAPSLTPSLPAGQWQTDASPNLVVTWPAPVDGSGITNKWAVIDANPTTSPTTPVGANQVARLLDQPGVYYAHLRVRDGAGNEAISHSGPFPINRTLTPSVNLPDGSIGEGEYPNGALLNYDPYAAFKPAALWGTWDATRLYLGMSGHDWSEKTPLALYFDTRSGGINSSLPISASHTLPFAADFAFVVGRPTDPGFSLYRVSGASWLPVANPASFAVLGADAEMVLDRAELQMTGAVGLVAMAEDADVVAPDGVWAVLPAASRPATETYLGGPVALAGPGLTWPGGLSNGRLPNAGLTQVVAPQIVFNPEWDNALSSGRSASFQLVVRNPDIGPYANIPLSLQVDPLLALTGVQGATCQSCPPNGNQWTLLANVGASSVQTLTVQARTMGQDFNGVKALAVQAGLANSGLPANPQPFAHAQYFLDHGATTVKLMKAEAGDIFTKPGAFDLPILVDIELDTSLRCSSQVEVNPGGSGWQPVCQVGDCTVVVGSVALGGSQTIQIRTTALNGRSSTPVVRTIFADSTPPITQIAAAVVMSGPVAYLKGLAWDAFPTSRAPARVEVSIDGKRYRPAILAATRNQALAAGEEATTVAPWRFPLKLTSEDGKVIQVQARAIDEAGNFGPATRPMQIVLDNLGPKLTWELVEDRIQGTARDGSGVRSLEISLDGGVRYLPIPVNGVEWSFELSSWPGLASSFALLRASDVHGNKSTELAPLPEATGVERVWLPRVAR